MMFACRGALSLGEEEQRSDERRRVGEWRGEERNGTMISISGRHIGGGGLGRGGGDGDGGRWVLSWREMVSW